MEATGKAKHTLEPLSEYGNGCQNCHRLCDAPWLMTETAFSVHTAGRTARRVSLVRFAGLPSSLVGTSCNIGVRGRPRHPPTEPRRASRTQEVQARAMARGGGAEWKVNVTAEVHRPLRHKS